ncbi:MAG: tetratricopeptide repeat protein [bacterium]|nr:tetratricopeptide repeat protein [bacterium]
MGIIAGILFIAVIAIVAVLVATGSDGKKYAKHMESAQRYINELDYEQAVAEYRAAIEIEPNNVEAYRALAELYVQTGDYESAVAVLNQGIEQTGSRELSEYIEEVQTEYEEQKRLAEASAQEEESVAEDSRSQDDQEQTDELEETDEERYSNYLVQAQELIDEQNYEEAVGVYETAIELLPEREEAYRKLAELYVMMKNYEFAMEILNRGIEQTESEELQEYLEEVESAQEREETKEQAEAEQEQGREQFQDSQPGQETVQGETTDSQESANGIQEEKESEVDLEEGPESINGIVLENGEEIEYKENGEYVVYEYNQDGKVTKSTEYYPDGTVIRYKMYEYEGNVNYSQ